MRLISINDIEEDQILAQPVYDINGRRLLAKGMRLKRMFIDRLLDRGILSIYIEDEVSIGIEVDDILCIQTRIQAKKVVKDKLDRFLQKNDVDHEIISKTVQEIVEEILSSKTKMINLKDIRLQDEFTFAHSVNVCVLSVMLATRLGYPKSKVVNIGIGALMHDFGKVMLSNDLLNVEDCCIKEDDEELKKHPLIGYNLIKDDSSIPATVKVSVLMHHERIDGSGYPLGLKEDKIHYSAKIIAIVETFDSLTCDRVFKNDLSNSDAVEYLTSQAGIVFDKFFVDEFLKHIPIFPNGTIVLLSNGLIGIVLKNNSTSLLRPVVRMLFNPKTKTKYSTHYIVDLLKAL